MISIFDELILNSLEHHIEAILDIIFSSSRHLLDNLRPLITNWQSLLENLDILFQRERVSFDTRVQEVDPSLATLFSVTICIKALVELNGYVAPLFCAILTDQANQLFVLFFTPITFLNCWFLVLIKFVLTLRVIPTWNKSCNGNPVIFTELLGLKLLGFAVLFDSPNKQSEFIIGPVLFGLIWLFALFILELDENFWSLLIIKLSQTWDRYLDLSRCVIFVFLIRIFWVLLILSYNN